LLIGACSSASHEQQPGPVVKLSFCGGHPQVQPSVIGVVCASDAITARHLTWSAWGQPISSAIGTAVVDLCAYSECAYGIYKTVPIVLIASKITTCGKSMPAYSRLQYLFVGPSPFKGVPNAHGQDVSLTC